MERRTLCFTIVSRRVAAEEEGKKLTEPAVFGFPEEIYKTKFVSSGDSVLAKRIIELYKGASIPARLSSKREARGEDGRGFQGPGLGALLSSFT